MLIYFPVNFFFVKDFLGFYSTNYLSYLGFLDFSFFPTSVY